MTTSFLFMSDRTNIVDQDRGPSRLESWYRSLTAACTACRPFSTMRTGPSSRVCCRNCSRASRFVSQITNTLFLPIFRRRFRLIGKPMTPSPGQVNDQDNCALQKSQTSRSNALVDLHVELTDEGHRVLWRCHVTVTLYGKSLCIADAKMIETMTSRMCLLWSQS